MGRLFGRRVGFSVRRVGGRLGTAGTIAISLDFAACVEEDHACDGDDSLQPRALMLAFPKWIPRERMPSGLIDHYNQAPETVILIDFHMPDLSQVNHRRRGEALIQHILEQWESEGTGPELKVLLRAAGTHEKARRRFVEVVQRQALPVILEVVKQDRKEERSD